MDKGRFRLESPFLCDFYSFIMREKRKCYMLKGEKSCFEVVFGKILLYLQQKSI